MRPLPLDARDDALIDAACQAVARARETGDEFVGAALRTRSGCIYDAVHLRAEVGRVGVCAEAVALGKAISEGERNLDAIVAVRFAQDEFTVISPCGICRELLSDHSEDLTVIVTMDATSAKVAIMDLIPAKRP